MSADVEEQSSSNLETSSIELPAPTAWPMAFALGLALIVAGMVTSPWVALVGASLAIVSGAGWFRQVLPHERHEKVAASEVTVQVSPSKRQVARLPEAAGHLQAQPAASFSLLAGIKGGIAGGTAMIVPAVLYGLLKHHSVWYAVNLLAAGGFPSWANQGDAFFDEFHWKGIVAASIIHSITCPLVGLLYAAALPMFPKRPILIAGFVVPLFWSSLLYGVLGLVSPILNQRIDWAWFIPSQLAFGLVTGYVVNRSVHVRTFQDQPFAVRAGLHTDVSQREEQQGGKH